MPTRCVVGGCSNTGKKDISLHLFPKNEHVRRQWMRAVRMTRKIKVSGGGKLTKEFTPSESSKVCSAHFKADDYLDVGGLATSFGLKSFKAMLKPEAVPSIFIADTKQQLTSSVAVEVPQNLNLRKKRKSAVIEKREHESLVAAALCGSDSVAVSQSVGCGHASLQPNANEQHNLKGIKEQQTPSFVVMEVLIQEGESRVQPVLSDDIKIDPNEVKWEEHEAVTSSPSQLQKATPKENQAQVVSSPPTNLMTLEEANAMWKEFVKRAPREFFSENNIPFPRSINSSCEAPRQLGDATTDATNSLPGDTEDSVKPSTGGESAVNGAREESDQGLESEMELESEEEEMTRNETNSDDDYEPDLGDLSDSSSSLEDVDNGESEEVEKKKKYPPTEKQCKICDKVVVNLTGHMKFIHGGKNLLCPHCGEKFKYASTFNAHVRKHTGDLFYCDQCAKSFSSNKVLDEHVSLVHTQPTHACALCPKKFSSAQRLAKHAKIVHDKVRDFLCPDCGKTFGTKAILGRHRLTHSGERKFECDLCGATFNQNSNLRIHKRSHNNNPDFMKKREWYSCPRCQVRCGNKKGLETHLKSHDI